MTESPMSVDAITLFVEDLEPSKSFYQNAFGLPIFFEDANSAVFKFANTPDQSAQDPGGTRSHRAGPGGESGGRVALPADHSRG